MLTYVFYKKGSQHEQKAADFAKELGRNRLEVRLIEADSRDGIRLCELYDIMGRPGIVVAGPNSEPLASWQHEFPLVSEVSYVAHR